MYDTAGLSLPHLSAEDRRHRLLTTCLPKDEPLQEDYLLSICDLWSPDYYGLDRVHLFCSSNMEEKAAILHQINQGTIAETYFVEKMGVGYTARMVLLSETLEERMLYALFSAQETLHLSQVGRLFPDLDSEFSSTDPFLTFLSQLTESSDRALLLLVVQVVLEGWGLSHYRSLADGCADPQVSMLYRGFLQDETCHHAMGVISFQESQVTDNSYAAILEALGTFLRMVQIGPQRVIGAIEQVKGHLSVPEKIQILTELETERHSGSRLQLIRSLLQRVLPSSSQSAQLLDQLDAHGCFIPCPPHRCL